MPGTAISCLATGKGVPHALLHNLKHNKVLHERVVILTVITEEVPSIADAERINLTDWEAVFTAWKFASASARNRTFPMRSNCAMPLACISKSMETSFFLSRETLIPTKLPGMAIWRDNIFRGDGAERRIGDAVFQSARQPRG